EQEPAKPDGPAPSHKVQSIEGAILIAQTGEQHGGVGHSATVRERRGHSLRLIAPACARVGTSECRPNFYGIIRKCSVRLNHLGALSLPCHEVGNARPSAGVVRRQFVTNDGSFFLPANVGERISQEKLEDRFAFFSDPQLSYSFIDPSERQKIIHREVTMR